MFPKKNKIIDQSFLSKEQEDEFINSLLNFDEYIDQDEVTEENEIITPSSLCSSDVTIYDDVIETGQIQTPVGFGLDEMQGMLREAMNEEKWSRGDDKELNKIIVNYCEIYSSNKPRNTRECFEYFLQVIQNQKGLGNFTAEKDTKDKFESCFSKRHLRDTFFRELITPFIFLLKQLKIEEMAWIFQQSCSKRCRRFECIKELQSEFLNKLTQCNAEQAKVIHNAFASLNKRNVTVKNFIMKVDDFVSQFLDLSINESFSEIQTFDQNVSKNEKNFYPLTLVEMQEMLQMAMKENTREIKNSIEEIIINITNICYNSAPRNTRECFGYFLQVIQSNLITAFIKIETQQMFKKVFQKETVRGHFFQLLCEPFIPLLCKLKIEEMVWIFQKSGSNICQRPECIKALQEVFLSNLKICSVTKCIEIQNNLTTLNVSNKSIRSFKEAVNNVVSSVIAGNRRQLSPIESNVAQNTVSIDNFFLQRIQVLSNFKENRSSPFSLPASKKVKYSDKTIESSTDKNIEYLPKSPKNG